MTETNNHELEVGDLLYASEANLTGLNRTYLVIEFDARTDCFSILRNWEGDFDILDCHISSWNFDRVYWEKL